MLVTLPVAARHLAWSSLLLRGLEKKIPRLRTVSGGLSCPRVRLSHVTYHFAVYFQHLYDRVVAVRTLPGGLRC
jgi:hypothetical protein